MAETRLARELESRTQTERPKTWQPASALPEPDKEPGYAYRWIRVSNLNVADPSNVSAKMREGWEPVKAEEQPKFQMMVDPNSRFKNNIEVGGLLLCKTPTDFVDQRNAHFAKVTQSQTDAVDNSFMRQSDARMPLFQERKSSSSFGKGT